MIFKIITLFPDFFKTPLETSLLGKAVKSGIIEVEIIDLKDFSEDKFHRCDDYPYGGGSGMVLRAGPLSKAIESVKAGDSFITMMTPCGSRLDQEMVKRLAEKKEIILICGHYEGVDNRVIDKYVDLEISIGDYILSGGEYAALILVDSISRLIPGFMSNSGSLEEESFEDSLLEYPHYTRPEIYDGMAVPETLLRGNHGDIAKWRLDQRIKKTKSVRPDLYKRYISKKLRGE